MKNRKSSPVVVVVALLIALCCLCGGAAIAQGFKLQGAHSKYVSRHSMIAGRHNHRHDPAPAPTTTVGPTPAPDSAPAPAPMPAPTPVVMSTAASTSVVSVTPAPAPVVTPAPSPKPTPTPTPAPTQSASSELLFSGDSIDDFLNQSAPGAVSEVADPAGSGQKVFKMNVNNSDVYPITPTDNPRAELVSKPIFNSGSEFWASMKFYLPAEFPSSVPGWLTLLEGPYGEPFADTPPWHIEVNGATIQWSRNSTYGYDVPWKMPLVRGSWVNVMLHERFASDGWIEMWVNGQPITFFASGGYNPSHVAQTTRLAMQTMDASTNAGPSAIHLMNYRLAGMFESVSLDEGPLAVGTTRASVEG